MDFLAAKDYILKRMELELKPELVYHSLVHTMDVYNSTVSIAEKEGVNGKNLTLLKTAALYHDSGMLNTYIGHEEASVEIVNTKLPEFNYSEEDISKISGMILTTKLPQKANNYYDKILCDADLDYLGRDDYFMRSHFLRHEWCSLGIKNLKLRQWYELQKEFMKTHKYFTKTSIELRKKKKQRNLDQIMELLKNNL